MLWKPLMSPVGMAISAASAEAANYSIGSIGFGAALSDWLRVHLV